MELTTTRNIEGYRWSLDKLGRWRSTYWCRWVAANYTGPISEDASPSDWIEAAHMRYPGCGISAKPADCLIYAMAATDHRRAHNAGQDSLLDQWRRVTSTMLLGLERKALVASGLADGWIRSQHLVALQCDPDLSTPAIESTARRWADFFVAGRLSFNDFNEGPIPY